MFGNSCMYCCYALWFINFAILHGLCIVGIAGLFIPAYFNIRCGLFYIYDALYSSIFIWKRQEKSSIFHEELNTWNLDKSVLLCKYLPELSEAKEGGAMTATVPLYSVTWTEPQAGSKAMHEQRVYHYYAYSYYFF